MAEVVKPGDVVRRLIEGISDGSFEELAQLYAEDAVVEHPYATGGPSRIEGRATLHERFAGARVRAFKLSASNVVVHETVDPEVVIVEYDYDVEAPEFDKRFSTANVLVVRVRHGLIVHSRDFHDHHAFAELIDSAR